MEMSAIISVAQAAVIIMAALAVIFGLGLAIAAKVFAVDIDPRVEQVNDELPGANCSACGFPGCSALAEAIVKGEAPADACPVATPEAAARICKIMGVQIEARTPVVAIVRCKGGPNVGECQIYDGIQDCRAASLLTGGILKNCEYACLGLGTCADACPFDAISMRGGTPYVNEKLCTGCGQCVAACPKDIIELMPIDKHVPAQCLSHAKGKIVNRLCKVGCIACKLCEKVCKKDAIIVIDNLAKTDYNVCVNCGLCVNACPKDVRANFRKARKAGAAVPQAKADYGKKKKPNKKKDPAVV